MLRALGFAAARSVAGRRAIRRDVRSAGRLPRAERGRGRLRLGRRHRRRASTPTGPGGCSTRSRSAAGSGSRPAPSSPAGCSPPTSRPGTCCCCTAAWSSSPTGSPGPRAGTWPSAWTPRSNAPTQAELELIAALFSADALQPPAEGGEEPLAAFVDELPPARRRRVRRAARGPARVRADHRQRGPRPAPRRRACSPATSTTRQPGQGPGPAVAALPVPDPVPAVRRGPPGARHPARRRRGLRGRLLAWPASATSSPAASVGEEARTSFHLYESLDLLFRMVNDGHRARGNASTDGLSEGEGLRFEALKADLFDPARTRLIGRSPTRLRRGRPDAPRYDTRLRDGPCTRCCAGSCSPRAAGRTPGQGPSAAGSSPTPSSASASSARSTRA